MKITFNYVEHNPQSASRSAKRGDKRGATSASSRMLAEREQDIATEQGASGQPPRWPGMYAFMRCRKQSCDLGPHCWVDSNGKHHKMRSAHFNMLETHVAQHGIPATHKDVPLHLQQQLIAEDRERHARKGKQISVPDAEMPPPHTTHIVQGHPQSTPQGLGEQNCRVPGCHANVGRLQRLDFPGLRDDALQRYALWQQSMVRDPLLKAGFDRACGVALKEGYFLECIYEDPKPDLFVQEAVPRGVAWYFCRRKDIEAFSSHTKRIRLNVDEDDD